ncbi:TnpV protein [Sinanaerobacter sp. ZZT-01]|uniref:TnpV protein n=1 Tax=Sinanaerobacter sp. ZZT-01 TaxID=3111540 RepID=UPI002D77A63D|nr:TnpV protein [Sinanaerobacter sp. ZZT-01]WRR93359.1 TnpV protein [Sinanaerobacter sp. ZZT-01]
MEQMKQQKGEFIMTQLTYQKNGDYFIPEITLDEQPEGTLTKYGLMRKEYLKEYKGGTYSGLLLSNKLKEHLLQIQQQAEERLEVLMEQMKKSEGITEELKAENQMLWVQKMNNIQHSAEEIVLTELIYS